MNLYKLKTNKNKYKEYLLKEKERRIRWKLLGLCYVCKEKLNKYACLCDACNLKSRESQRNTRANRVKNNQCIRCGERLGITKNQTCQDCIMSLKLKFTEEQAAKKRLSRKGEKSSNQNSTISENETKV